MSDDKSELSKDNEPDLDIEAPELSVGLEDISPNVI